MIPKIQVLPAREAIYGDSATGEAVLVTQAGPIGTTYIDNRGRIVFIGTREFQERFIHEDICNIGRRRRNAGAQSETE
jgi:hypothetical protein